MRFDGSGFTLFFAFRSLIETRARGPPAQRRDREAWTFRRFDQAGSSPAAAFEDVVIDTRLGGQDRELQRRVRTMPQFVGMIRGLRPREGAPHERAIEVLGPGSLQPGSAPARP